MFKCTRRNVSVQVQVWKCQCVSVSVEVSVFKRFSGRTLRNAFGKNRTRKGTRKELSKALKSQRWTKDEEPQVTGLKRFFLDCDIFLRNAQDSKPCLRQIIDEV